MEREQKSTLKHDTHHQHDNGWQLSDMEQLSVDDEDKNQTHAKIRKTINMKV